MPKLKLNLTDASVGFDPIPPGKYPIEVVDADVRIGKESKKPYLWLRLKITEGDYEKRNLFAQHTLNTESTGLNVTATTLTALLGEGIMEDPKFELDTDDLIGLRALALTSMEKGQEGEDREKVRYLKPLEGEAAVREDEKGEAPW